MTVKEQHEKAYIAVEDILMAELIDAEKREDIHDLLYAELARVIEQYNLSNITPDYVIPEFYAVWGLRS